MACSPFTPAIRRKTPGIQVLLKGIQRLSINVQWRLILFGDGQPQQNAEVRRFNDSIMQQPLHDGHQSMLMRSQQLHYLRMACL
jgi:hypothetical protein